VGLVQVGEVLRRRPPPGAESPQHLTPAGHQLGEAPLFLLNDRADELRTGVLAELGQRVLDQRDRQVPQRHAVVRAPQRGEHAPEQPPQHVAAAAARRPDAVADDHDAGAQVVSDQAQGRLAGLPQAGQRLHPGPEDIGGEHRGHALRDHQQPLQAHPGVHVGLGQRL
jgi:hypothetical protein